MKQFALLLCLFPAIAFAQQGEAVLKSATVHVLVNDVTDANSGLETVIKKWDLKIAAADINNTARDCSYTLYSKAESLYGAIADIEKLGVIQLKQIQSLDFKAKLDEHTYDLKYLTEQKEVYHSELSSTDKKSDSYRALFNKERDIDKQIYDLNKEIMELRDKSGYSVIELELSERVVQDLDSDSSRMNLINMPGVEARFFNVENPGDSALEKQYLGASLRYMFTKGRTYFCLGVMKPLTETESASTRVEDIVSYSIGTDFYPRYLGRGKLTFLNLYSGFELGGMILTSNDDIEHVFTLEPHFGVELFKNKYVILDTRAGYLLPLDRDRIESHRGLTANISLNVVF